VTVSRQLTRLGLPVTQWSRFTCADAQQTWLTDLRPANVYRRGQCPQ